VVDIHLLRGRRICCTHALDMYRRQDLAMPKY
jgi:hypothetical protein